MWLLQPDQKQKHYQREVRNQIVFQVKSSLWNQRVQCHLQYSGWKSLAWGDIAEAERNPSEGSSEERYPSKGSFNERISSKIYAVHKQFLLKLFQKYPTVFRKKIENIFADFNANGQLSTTFFEKQMEQFLGQSWCNNSEDTQKTVN